MALFGSKTTNTEDKKKKPAAAKKAPAKKAEVATEPTSMKDLYAETPKTTTSKAKTSSVKYSVSSKFIVKPLITEKATHLASENKYVFVVTTNANKIEVAKAINAIYGVKPVDVNMVNMKGKKVARGRIRGQRKDWKKAIVTLAKGQEIKIYEGV